MARIKRFAEFEIQVGIDDGVAEPSEELPIVIPNIAIMQRDDIAIPGSQQVAVREPAGTALAIRPGTQAVLVQQPQQPLHARAIDPDK